MTTESLLVGTFSILRAERHTISHFDFGAGTRAIFEVVWSSGNCSWEQCGTLKIGWLSQLTEKQLGRPMLWYLEQEPRKLLDEAQVKASAAHPITMHRASSMVSTDSSVMSGSEQVGLLGSR